MNAPLSACWRADDARAIFVTEALEGDDAIFLATHTPIEGFEVAGRDAGEFAEANERAVLETLSEPTRQHAFCVVQGEPGSGKSHLIRWLSVNWPATDRKSLLLRRADGSLEGALRQLRDRLPEFSHLSIISASGNAHPRKVAQTSFSARSPTRWSRATSTCPRSMMSGAGNMRPPSCWRTPKSSRSGRVHRAS